jgi:hypothetical protein
MTETTNNTEQLELDPSLTLDDMLGAFAVGVAKERERLGLRLIAIGQTPQTAQLCEQIWYDELAMEMKYKCWAQPIEQAQGVAA